MKDKANNDYIGFMDILLVLVRHIRIIFGITIISAAGILVYAIVSLLLPPEESYLPNVYESKSIMLINESSSDGLSSALNSSGMSSLTSLMGFGSGNRNNGLLAISIASMDMFLDIIVDEFDMTSYFGLLENEKSKARISLRALLRTEYEEQTGLFYIKYEDIDPEFATKIVNFASEQLVRRFAQISGNKNLIKKQQLEKKMSEVSIEIEKLEDQMQDFQRKYNIISIESLATEQASTIAQVRSEIFMKEMEIQTYSSLAKVEDPQIRRLRTEKESLQKFLKEVEEGFIDINTNFPSQKDFAAIALEYSHLERNLMIQVEIYKLLIQQFEMTKLALSGEEPVFQIIEKAKVPDIKSGPSRGMLCIVFTGMAFLFSVCLAFVLEGVSHIKYKTDYMTKLRKAWRGK